MKLRIVRTCPQCGYSTSIRQDFCAVCDAYIRCSTPIIRHFRARCACPCHTISGVKHVRPCCSLPQVKEKTV